MARKGRKLPKAGGGKDNFTWWCGWEDCRGEECRHRTGFSRRGEERAEKPLRFPYARDPCVPLKSPENCARMGNNLSFRVDRQGLTGHSSGEGDKEVVFLGRWWRSNGLTWEVEGHESRSLNSEPEELATLWWCGKVNFCFLFDVLVKISLLYFC